MPTQKASPARTPNLRVCRNKTCSKCSILYAEERFSKHRCIHCVRQWQQEYYWRNRDKIRKRTTEWNKVNVRSRHACFIKSAHGITLDQYEAMLAAQGGVCAICKQPETVRHKNGAVRRLPIDHDHATGAVRDLLCYRCNSMIGYSRERIDLLEGAIQYIQKHKRDIRKAS